MRWKLGNFCFNRLEEDGNNVAKHTNSRPIFLFNYIIFIAHPENVLITSYLLSFFFLVLSGSFQLLVPMLLYSSMSQLRTEIFLSPPQRCGANQIIGSFLFCMQARFTAQARARTRVHRNSLTLWMLRVLRLNRRLISVFFDSPMLRAFKLNCSRVYDFTNFLMSAGLFDVSFLVFFSFYFGCRSYLDLIKSIFGSKNFFIRLCMNDKSDLKVHRHRNQESFKNRETRK